MTTFKRFTILAVLLLAAIVAASADGEFRFIEKGDMVDLAELRDGETRTFGEGEHRISATRDGDHVRITRDPAADGKALDLTCDVGRDTCQVMTSSENEHVMISVEKRRECNGDDCDDIEMQVMALAGVDAAIVGAHGMPGAHMRKIVIDRECADGEECNTWIANSDGADVQVVVERVECTDDGDGEECETFVWHGDDPDAVTHDVHGMPGMAGMPGGAMVFIDESGHPTVLGGDRVVLNCPEGDARLRVEKDEADDTFLCPKHSVPLERAKTQVMPHGAQRRVKIKRP